MVSYKKEIKRQGGRYKKIIGILVDWLMLPPYITSVYGQEQKQSRDDLAAKTLNPVGAMYSLPFKFSFDYGADNGEARFLNIQPVLPLAWRAV